MFTDLSFSEASNTYQKIKASLPDLLETFGECAMECIVDALHCYAKLGFAEECCNYDLDFARLFTLAYRELYDHDLKPEHSCLTDWSGNKWP